MRHFMGSVAVPYEANRMNWFLDRSYSRSFIWITVAVTLLAGLFVAAVLSFVVEPRQTPLTQESPSPTELFPMMSWDEEDIQTKLADRAADPEALLEFAIDLQIGGNGQQRLWALHHWPTPDTPQDENEIQTRGAIDTVGPYILTSIGDEITPSLDGLSQEDPPRRWVNRGIADFLIAYSKRRAALDYYVTEGNSFADADYARSMAWHLAQQYQQFDLIDRWREQEHWQEQFGPIAHMDYASRNGDFLVMLDWLLPSRYFNFDIIMALVAAVAAAVWGGVVFHSSYGAPRRWELGAQCICGFLLGIVSTWVTVYLIYVYRHFGFDEGETSLSQAIYCFAGIGLREEFAKILCFLPLIPWVMKRGNSLSYLLVASCVGIGFAAEENINYFTSSLGSAVSGRFLTANFLHLALTGLAGQAICQAIAFPRTHGTNAFAIFIAAVTVHGLYNAFIIVDVLMPYNIGSMIVFILLGNYYFYMLRDARPHKRPQLSLTMLFCGGLAFVLAASLALLTIEVGFGTAVKLLISGTLTFIIIVVMFIRGINDNLAD